MINYQTFHANVVLGSKRILLRDIAEDNNLQDHDIMRARGIWIEKYNFKLMCLFPLCFFVFHSELVGRLKFKFEFEEIFDFHLDFKDWMLNSTVVSDDIMRTKYQLSVSSMRYFYISILGARVCHDRHVYLLCCSESFHYTFKFVHKTFNFLYYL